jgi:prepilin-type N-terminal cleavage/methylation domain-containing protein
MRGIQKDNYGFTAIELILTIVVLAIVFTTFTSTLSTLKNVNKKALDISQANTLAFAKVQDYENKPYASLPNTTPSGTLVMVEDFSSSLPTSLKSPTGKVYINTISSTLKQVIVDVEYGSTNDPHTIQYADFIQKNGL